MDAPQKDGKAERLPADRKITERGKITDPPFGPSPDGGRINDISGKVIRSVVMQLREVAGPRAVEQLCAKLNDVVEDEALHVDEEFLLNEWNAYGYEYYHFLLEYSKQIADDDQLIYKRGARTVPRALIAILRPLPFQQIFELIPRLAARFVSHANLEVISTSATNARIRMRVDPRYEKITRPYELACRRNACDSYRGTIASIPALMVPGTPWASVREEMCCAKGDPYCEWVFSWRDPRPRSWAGLVGAGVLALLAVLLTGFTGLWTPWVGVGAGFAVAFGVLFDHVRRIRWDLVEKARLLGEQSEEFENNYDELENAHDRLQILNLDLERQVLSRTAELREANNKLARLAITDELTRLYNRRHFYQRLEEELQRAGRYGNAVSLLMIDVDHFKEYNDKFGHLRGDRVLRSLAEVLTKETRSMDTVARYGGEEFVILLPETSLDGAVEVAHKLQRTVESREEGEGVDNLLSNVTISIGVACIQDTLVPAEKLILQADEALYRAKANGRNRVEAAR